MITEVTPSIKYVGVDDHKIDLFESQYMVPDGMCYNSYVIIDEQCAIMDGVDGHFTDEWLRKVEAALEGRKPQFIVVHHAEPDHSGSVMAALERWPELKVVCSLMASKFLKQFDERLDAASRVITVKEGQSIELGQKSLQFIAAPFVHWPEVLMSYCPEEQVLFSADGFGKFGAYDADPDDWACEARRYYFNICGKYGAQVSKALDKASKLPGIKAICSLHGPVLQGERLQEALRLYRIWSHYEVETQGVFIAYASIYGGTRRAAFKLKELLEERGVKNVAISDLAREDMAECIEDAFRYSTTVCCASSYDGDVFPPMHTFLHKLVLKGFQRRRMALVENGTWAPSAAKAMKALIAEMKEIELIEPTVTIKSTLHDADLPALTSLADAVSKAI